MRKYKKNVFIKRLLIFLMGFKIQVIISKREGKQQNERMPGSEHRLRLSRSSEATQVHLL